MPGLSSSVSFGGRWRRRAFGSLCFLLRSSPHAKTCSACLLKAIDGVAIDDVRIGSAVVDYDETKLTPRQIAQAVSEEGYLVVGSH